MPRKAEHLSFQGKKILKIGAWVTELLHFLCSYSNFVRVEPSMKKRGTKGEISKNAKIDDANLLITPLFINRFSKSFFPPKAVMLSFQRKKEFLKSVQKHGSYEPLCKDKIGVTPQKMK